METSSDSEDSDFEGFDGGQPDEEIPSNYVPYDQTGLENKIIGLDERITEEFGLTYDNQLANLDSKDYRFGRLIGQHLQTLKTIEKQLGEEDCLADLTREYLAKLEFMLVLSKSLNQALLKTLRSSFTYGQQAQEFKQVLPSQPKKKRKFFGVELPI